MFEVTGDDIADLSDSDLRTLIGLLCEAELRRAGLPASGATWGGNQNAKDGGLDVRIEVDHETPLTGFIPRPLTGFQVKVPDMARADILKEMSPGGVLRPAIAEVVEMGGAYIIVSAQGSVSDSALKARRAAMRDALASLTHAQNTVTDFYDRNRVATWVRDHPGIVPWVRRKIGRPLAGWKSWEDWTDSQSVREQPYLVDETMRITDGKYTDEGELPILEGINRMRTVLTKDHGTLRLIGLSGVGKTRLAQALFEDTIGKGSLDPALAVYANMADQPDPSPVALAAQFVSFNQRAILAVDNCPPDLHNRLVSVCSNEKSRISLITIEYDIREDQPEATDVFRLGAASDGVIKQLIRHRFPAVTQLDATRIAEFSGGNARIAIAVANTLTAGATLAGLKDDSLFERLFDQRHNKDKALLRAAEACSLLYSFEGETEHGSDAELPGLGRLCDQTYSEMFHHVAELLRRDLLQKRSVWRAVLPHAIANRLARRALEGIPTSRIRETFVTHATPRMLRSFARRLSYLHDCPQAILFATEWLAEDGLLKLSHLTWERIPILRSVAPVVPELLLQRFEQAADNAIFAVGNINRSQFALLLRSIAYEPQWFERCCKLLIEFAVLESNNTHYHATRPIFLSLFPILLSGTHASVEQRLAVVSSLLGSDSAAKNRLGLDALDQMLESYHFTSSSTFEFGARSRDFGWRPKTDDECYHWFSTVLSVAKKISFSAEPTSSEIRKILAHRFRMLWHYAGCPELIERIVADIGEEGHWPDGWLAVRQTIKFDRQRNAEDIDERHAAAQLRLLSLERCLRPKSLIERAHAFILTQRWGALDIADIEEEGPSSDGYVKVEAAAEKLGEEIAQDSEALKHFLPAAQRSQEGRLFSFGRGLARGTGNLAKLWALLVSGDTANVALLTGFLSVASTVDSEVTKRILDEALESEGFLGRIFPALQLSIENDLNGINRLYRALERGLSPKNTFWALAHCKWIPEQDIHRLVSEIARDPEGYETAINIFCSHVYASKREKQPLSGVAISTGRSLVMNFNFETPSEMLDYHLGEIIEVCFGEDARPEAAVLSRRLMATTKSPNHILFEYETMLAALAKQHPEVFLDEIVAESFEARGNYGRLFFRDGIRRGNVLDNIADNTLVQWAEASPEKRYPLLAATIKLFKRRKEKGRLEWTSAALQILQIAPNPRAVLAEYGARIRPTNWTGSLAQKLRERQALVEELSKCSSEDLDQEIKAIGERLAREIDSASMRERERDERFE